MLSTSVQGAHRVPVLKEHRLLWSVQLEWAGKPTLGLVKGCYMELFQSHLFSNVRGRVVVRV